MKTELKEKMMDMALEHIYKVNADPDVELEDVPNDDEAVPKVQSSGRKEVEEPKSGVPPPYTKPPNGNPYWIDNFVIIDDRGRTMKVVEVLDHRTSRNPEVVATFKVDVVFIEDNGDQSTSTVWLPWRLFLRGGYVHEALWTYIININKKNQTTGDLLTPTVNFGMKFGACNAIKDLIKVITFGE